jgi:hypothetical protein
MAEGKCATVRLRRRQDYGARFPFAAATQGKTDRTTESAVDGAGKQWRERPVCSEA